jgi:hypothetical protein
MTDNDSQLVKKNQPFSRRLKDGIPSVVNKTFLSITIGMTV